MKPCESSLHKEVSCESAKLPRNDWCANCVSNSRERASVKAEDVREKFDRARSIASGIGNLLSAYGDKKIKKVGNILHLSTCNIKGCPHCAAASSSLPSSSNGRKPR